MGRAWSKRPDSAACRASSSCDLNACGLAAGGAVVIGRLAAAALTAASIARIIRACGAPAGHRDRAVRSVLLRRTMLAPRTRIGPRGCGRAFDETSDRG